MIRVGCRREGQAHRLIAELDLTGAPHSPALMRTGLETLQAAMRWLGPVIDLVMDPQLDLPEFTLSLPTNTKTKRKDPL